MRVVRCASVRSGSRSGGGGDTDNGLIDTVYSNTVNSILYSLQLCMLEMLRTYVSNGANATPYCIVECILLLLHTSHYTLLAYTGLAGRCSNIDRRLHVQLSSCMSMSMAMSMSMSHVMCKLRSLELRLVRDPIAVACTVVT